MGLEQILTTRIWILYFEKNWNKKGLIFACRLNKTKKDISCPNQYQDSGDENWTFLILIFEKNLDKNQDS